MSAGLFFDALLAELGPQGIAVHFGSGKPEDAYPCEAAVFITLPDQGDAYSPPRGPDDDHGALRIADVNESVSLRIEAASSQPGSTFRDHYDAMKDYVARVLVAVHNYARGDRSAYDVVRGGFVLRAAENPQGAIYRIDLRLADQVLDEPLQRQSVSAHDVTTLLDPGVTDPVPFPGSAPAP